MPRCGLEESCFFFGVAEGNETLTLRIFQLLPKLKQWHLQLALVNHYLL